MWSRGQAIYYYVTNIQGDVTGITDTTGKLIISYFYTGYGDSYCVKHNSTSANILSAVNPLAYRGYVLDTQTKLYYLQSRYYDYTHGRFINADMLVSTGQGLLGNNMFAYCLNNPTNNSDPSGMIAAAVIKAAVKKAAIGAAINLGTSIVAALVTGQSFRIRDGIVAAVAGAASSLSPIAGGIVGGGYAAFCSFENGETPVGIIVSGVASFCCTAFCLGGLSKYLEGWAAIFVDSLFTFVSNLISAAVYTGVNDNSIYVNINAMPWVSPYYSTTKDYLIGDEFTPYPHTGSTDNRNVYACPWMYPDFSPIQN